MDVQHFMIMCIDTVCKLSLWKVFSRNPFYLHLQDCKDLSLHMKNMTVVSKPGKTMFLAGHLSRSCLIETKEALVPDLQVSKIHLTSYLPVSQEVHDRIRKETSQDDKLQQLLETVLDEWPNNKADLTTGNKSLLEFP